MPSISAVLISRLWAVPIIAVGCAEVPNLFRRGGGQENDRHGHHTDRAIANI